jgi:type I restriction enzyme M protein
MNTNEIVAKLWNLCHVLRDDGVTYQQYVTELTYLLFLKMAQEVKIEPQLPEGYRWKDLESLDGVNLLNYYRGMLLHLGTHGSKRVQAIYANAGTTLKQPRILRQLVENIDALDWFAEDKDDFGDLYEGLLEKNAGEVKSGAGQYFTPRVLIQCMVALVKPRPGELIQDPAAGTCGFLLAADAHIKKQTANLFDLTEAQSDFHRKRAFVGVELVQDAQRLGLMNLMLHGLESELILGDSLSPTGASLPKVDVILTNPPFGTKKGGGLPTRDDFTYPTSNKQLAFLQHIYRGLKPGGRAAVVLPDNVLFESNTGADIRADLMDKCDLHTILRLPTGIFYAQGVKTNVLFFTRGQKDSGNTKRVWIYDARTNAPSFGKRTPFTHAYLQDFETCFGSDPLGKSPRQDQGPEGRWRVFTREEIKARGENLDISWLKDDSLTHAEDLEEPEIIAAQILEKLRTAVEEMEALSAELEREDA